MKVSICSIFLLVGLTVFAKANEYHDNWPCYLKKCSRNDPNLNKCMLAHANRALEFIFLGDSKLGIPNFTPYVVQHLKFGINQTFKFEFDEGTVYGMPHMYVTDINWNFKAKTMEIKISYNNAISIYGNYACSGKFLDKKVEMKGHLHLGFIGGQYGANLTYNMQYDLLKILGKDYVLIKDRVCQRQEGFRTYFNNELSSKEEALEVVKYINAHANEANTALHEEMNELICSTVDKALNPIFYNFALDEIFDK